jgi:hypothetical protein
MTTDIKVGTRIRSFDFDDHATAGPRACFVEGIVLDNLWWRDCYRHKIYVTRRVFGGDEVQPAEDENQNIVYPPVNGTRKMCGGTTNAVEKI